MSLKKQALTSLVWTYAQQFGNQLIGFVVSLILARILMPEEFGLIGMIAVFVAVGNTLLHGGLTKSLIRSEDLGARDYSTVFYFNLAAGIVVYFGVFLLAPLVADFYSQPILTGILVFVLDYFGLKLEMDVIRIFIGGAVGSSVYLFTAFLFKFGSFFELSKLIFKK